MIGKLFATVGKDILLLWRDRAGLLVLFVMPAVLVVIITLVQNNVQKLMGETSARVIMVDLDDGSLGQLLAERMKGIKLVAEIDGAGIARDQAVSLVAGGDYQACIIIAAGTAKALEARARADAGKSLGNGSEGLTVVPELEILFDPTVMGGFRSALGNSLGMVLMEFEIGEKMKALSDLLPGFVERELKKSAGDFAEFIEVPPLKVSMSTEPLLTVKTGSASRRGLVVVPTPVQHNVPAWALFGMFFIVVPMAGSLIRERQEETLARLMSMPVPYPVIMAGRIAAYVLVCFVQFALILLIGRFLLPFLGVDSFRPGSDWLAILAVVAAAAMAAAGYGIMLGTLTRTYEQASMFGSISVVGASAIGGVMVPVYAMPAVMQKISVVSPIGWGLEAFLDIFVRGGGLATVSAELAMLLAFALVNALVAWGVFSWRAGST